MFSFILFSLAIISSVSALTLPRHHLPLPRRHLIVPRAQPQGWATGYLEGYDQYHTRYMALGCEGKHNTTFFNDCCHPLLVCIFYIPLLNRTHSSFSVGHGKA